jgi:hypothetical protein
MLYASIMQQQRRPTVSCKSGITSNLGHIQKTSYALQWYRGSARDICRIIIYSEGVKEVLVHMNLPAKAIMPAKKGTTAMTLWKG